MSKNTSNNLTDLHEEFLSEYKYAGNCSDETIRGHRYAYDLVIKLLPGTKLDSLTPRHMASFFQILNTRTRTLPNGLEITGVRSSTLATYRGKLNKFFKWLNARKYLEHDPFGGIPYPKVIYNDRKYLPGTDLEKIFGALQTTIDWSSPLIKRRNIAIFTVLLNCGLRRGELLGLKLSDVDIDKGELLVREEISKSKMDRYIPINSVAKAALWDYLQERKRGRFKIPFLLVSQAGDARLTVNGLKHLVAKVSAGSGVKFHPHQFRHTFAINLLINGTDIYKIKNLLGHLDIRMTASYLRGLPTKAMASDVEKLRLDKLV